MNATLIITPYSATTATCITDLVLRYKETKCCFKYFCNECIQFLRLNAEEWLDRSFFFVNKGTLTKMNRPMCTLLQYFVILVEHLKQTKYFINLTKQLLIRFKHYHVECTHLLACFAKLVIWQNVLQLGHTKVLFLPATLKCVCCLLYTSRCV